MSSKKYSTDLSKDSWSSVTRNFPSLKLYPNSRELFNALLYKVRTNLGWGELPSDFPESGQIFKLVKFLREEIDTLDFLSFLLDSSMISPKAFRRLRSHLSRSYIKVER